uniref:Uncharacterized protein n=1 Tax=viral metagenome TaxID=1070528 RepID=A0A6C0IH46_9ZZZZ
MSQATQQNATQANAQNATQPEEYVMEETPAPKPRFIPGAPQGRTYHRTSGHWSKNAAGNPIWIPSSPIVTGYKQMKSLRSMRRLPPTFSIRKASKRRSHHRNIKRRRTFKKINPNRK